jgi:glutamate 5-kinase
MAFPPLRSHRRITVKIGSALLVDRESGLKRAWLAALCEDIAALRAAGAEVLVVSSGAIALGRNVLGLGRRALKLEESQAAAAAGQIALAGAWSEELARKGLTAGQVLVTLGDTEERRRLPQCTRHHLHPAQARRGADHQRERHGGNERNPLWRQ